MLSILASKKIFRRSCRRLNARIFPVCAVFLLAVASPLWSLDPDTKIDRYILDEWHQSSGGIQLNSVTSIIQTENGYLWLGLDGEFTLLRYDGIQFKVFRREGLGSQAYSSIQSMSLDRDNTVWIGSYDGLTRFDYHRRRFEVFHDEKIQSSIVSYIYRDGSGKQWVSSNDALISIENGQISDNYSLEDYGIKMVTCILENEQGDLLAGTESGLFKIKNNTLIRQDLDWGKDEPIILALLEDSQGILWIGTNQGLLRIARGYRRVIDSGDGLADNTVTHLLEDSDGNIWAGTTNGCSRIQTDSSRGISIENTLKNTSIACIFEDREKSLWFGTSGSGLKRLRDRSFTCFTSNDGLPNDYVFSLYKDQSGKIWIGTLSGLCIYENGQFMEPCFEKLPADIAVRALAEDMRGNVWLGTYGGGLYRITNNAVVHYSQSNGLVDNIVYAIMAGRDGKVWIGTNGGISIFDGNEMSSYSLSGGVLTNVVTTFFEDEEGNLWIGTFDGLFLYENGNIREKHSKMFLEGCQISSIYSLDADELLVGTYGAGLKRIKGNETYAIDREEGLPSRTVVHMNADHLGNLWIGSDRGIIKVGLGDLNAVAGGLKNNIGSLLFDTADGLSSSECIYSSLVTSDGHFWFASKKGIISFRPEEIDSKREAPPIVIEALEYNDRVIDLEEDNILLPKRGKIKIVFSAPSFVSPEKIRFRTMLEGFEAEWKMSTVGEDRFRVFQNLPAGDYRFQVMAANSHGIWNESGTSLSFSIKRKFYENVYFWLFLILIMAAFSSVSYAFGSNYLKKRKLKKRYKRSPLDPEKASKLLEGIQALMENEKIYKDENLSLQSMADRMSISSKVLSQVINERLGINFAVYVNRFRVDEAKRMLSDPASKEKLLIDLAFEAGFKSKAAFNRIFKELAGMTPTDYRNSMTGGEI